MEYLLSKIEEDRILTNYHNKNFPHSENNVISNFDNQYENDIFDERNFDNKEFKNENVRNKSITHDSSRDLSLSNIKNINSNDDPSHSL